MDACCWVGGGAQRTCAALHGALCRTNLCARGVTHPSARAWTARDWRLRHPLPSPLVGPYVHFGNHCHLSSSSCPCGIKHYYRRRKRGHEPRIPVYYSVRGILEHMCWTRIGQSLMATLRQPYPRANLLLPACWAMTDVVATRRRRRQVDPARPAAGSSSKDPSRLPDQSVPAGWHSPADTTLVYSLP